MKRYGWPVIIAAGLHGALFLGLPAAPAEPEVGMETVPVVPADPPLVAWVPAPVEAGSASEASIAVKPLPRRPEIAPMPRAEGGCITVPIQSIPTAVGPVALLPESIGVSVGDATGPDGFGPRVLPDVGKLDRTPRAVARPVPRYPEAMRREGLDGSVTVQFVVDPTGRVVSAEAVQWTRREFVDPAVEAVRQWRFQPGTMQGRPVSFRMAVPIVFDTGG